MLYTPPVALRGPSQATSPSKSAVNSTRAAVPLKSPGNQPKGMTGRILEPNKPLPNRQLTDEDIINNSHDAKLNWLNTLGLRKSAAASLAALSWPQIIQLDDEALKAHQISTAGARKRLLSQLAPVRDRLQDLLRPVGTGAEAVEEPVQAPRLTGPSLGSEGLSLLKGDEDAPHTHRGRAIWRKETVL